MPKIVFSNTSRKTEHKIDTSLFVQNPYLRTICFESNIEDVSDLKNQIKTKNLHSLISPEEAASKGYVDKYLTIRLNGKTLHMLISTMKISITFVLLK